MGSASSFSPGEAQKEWCPCYYSVWFDIKGIFHMHKYVEFMSKPSVYGNVEYMTDVAFLHLVITYHAEEGTLIVSCSPGTCELK